MSEMEPQEEAIDRLLRRSLAAPVPSLPPNFDRRVMRGLPAKSPMLDRYRRLILICYGLLSAAVSAVVMRGQGLGWEMIAVMELVPLVSVATPWAWRAAHIQRGAE